MTTVAPSVASVRPQLALRVESTAPRDKTRVFAAAVAAACHLYRLQACSFFRR